MAKKRMLLSLCALAMCLPAIASVWIPKYYDNRQMPLVVRSDDLANGPGNDYGWDQHMKGQQWLWERGIAMEVGVIHNKINSGGKVALGQYMATNANLGITIHSASHYWGAPPGDDYEAEYLAPKIAMQTQYDLPWQYRYGTNQYVTVYAAIGTATNLNFALARSNLVSSAYMVLSAGRANEGEEESDTTYFRYKDNYPLAEWNEEWEMFENTGFTFSMSRIQSGVHPNPAAVFDTAYTNADPVVIVGHAYGPTERPHDPTNALLRAFFEHAGYRQDVWYTHCEHLFQYQYVRTVADLAITNMADGFSVSIPAADRERFGLGWPVTYVLTNATGIASGDLNAYYYGQGDTRYRIMPTLDRATHFHSNQGVRRDGDVFFVSAAFPQFGTNFTVRLARANPTRFRPEAGERLSIVIPGAGP